MGLLENIHTRLLSVVLLFFDWEFWGSIVGQMINESESFIMTRVDFFNKIKVFTDRLLNQVSLDWKELIKLHKEIIYQLVNQYWRRFVIITGSS